MISKPEMGSILQPLEKRFRKLTNEQADVYHDRLKYADGEVLKDAVVSLVDSSKVFPTPGEIREAVRNKHHERAKLGKSRDLKRGCPQCMSGYVFYELPEHDKYSMYPGVCAYCHKGEISIEPHVIQRNDQIFYACEKFTIDGQQHYRANPDVEDPYIDARPLKTNAWLKEYFSAPPLYTKAETQPYQPRRL
jgi:hypothetical protein